MTPILLKCCKDFSKIQFNLEIQDFKDISVIVYNREIRSQDIYEVIDSVFF